ncbi:protein phosphatase 1 regulatory subunit 26 [Heterodontus francisci]|uniref:protein phosphatase 1 regulatory subunit 26 n=1 Tax=Heterodontus francisci TaxID=7792 RepID=UPI00355B2A91
MFLMNLAPVSAVQTDWHPFGASQNFSLPVSFSDSGEEFPAVQSTVNVNVQMIIENLQANDSPCAMNNDPSSNAQTNIAAKRRSEGVLDGASIRVLKGAAVEDLKTGYPPCALGTEESNLGCCILDSDSDESVDRGIEEAIQEYLKKKTEDNSLISKAVHDTKDPPGTHAAIEDSAPKISNGISLGGEVMVPTELGLGFVNIDPHSVSLEAAGSKCSSPSSISSNDSFELSIQAEIERFLQDKRSKETGSTSTNGPENELAFRGKTEQKENLVKVGPKKRKRCVKSSVGSQMHLVKQSVMNAYTQVNNTNSTHFGESGTVCKAEKGSEGNPKGNKKLASEKKPKARHRFKELYKSSNAQWSLDAEFSEPKANPIIAQTELSDSSSDDGIEEAIQLYQLEQKKGKSEDVAFVLGLLPHKPPNTQKCADLSSDLKSMEKQTLQASLNKKRIHCVQKSGESCTFNLSDTDSSDQSGDDFVTQRERNAMDSRFGWEKRFQAETLSESSPKREGPLATKVQPRADSMVDMVPSENKECAGRGKAPREGATAISKQVISSSDSENSSADSSDSIEKEIQNYLALKANQSSQKPDQVGAGSELDRTFPQELKQEDSLNDSLSSLSSSSPQTLLSQKGRLKNNVSTDRELEVEELRESQPQDPSGAPVALANNGTVTSKIKLKGGSSEQDMFDVSNVWYGRTVNRDQEKLSRIKWAAENLSCGKPVRDAWQTDEKSSSLDSDEDLDTATKDLLKTRKKLGKRSRDTKNRCKKRVRFTGAEVLTYSEQSTGISDQSFKATGEVLAASHGPLKSCLSKSSKAACRSYLDFKSKGNKRIREQSGSENNGKVARIGKPKVDLLCDAPSSMADRLTQRTVAVGDSSSADSDDGIEQEILRFLAEKARVNSGLEEHTNEVQSFKKQGEESASSEMAAQSRKLSSLSQQAEGSRGANMKGLCHLEEETTACYSHRGTERAGTESKGGVNGQDYLQNIHDTRCAQRQTERRQVVEEPPADSKTETKAGIIQEHLQVGSTDCPGKGTGNCQSDWHSDSLQDKEVNTTPESCAAQNIQGKWSALALETTQPLIQEQNVQYIDPRLWAVGQHQPKAVQVRSSDKTVNKLKLWNVFQPEPLGDSAPVHGGKGSCREGEYSRSSQSDVGCSTDQSSHAAVNTHSHVGWAGSAKMKCEEGKNPGQPLGSLMLSASLGAHSSEASRLPCVARQEQSDHNYQSGVRSEVREQNDARVAPFDSVTQRLCEMAGPSSCLSVAAHPILSTDEETSRLEERGHSVGADIATETVIAEGTSEGEASSQCTSRGNGENLLASQWQPLNQALSGSKIEEQNNRGRRTEEAAEGKSPEAFYDKASDHSDDDSRVDTGRSGLQRQGAEV